MQTFKCNVSETAHQLHASAREGSDSPTICQMSHNARNQKQITTGDKTDAQLLEREELMPETSKEETRGTGKCLEHLLQGPLADIKKKKTLGISSNSTMTLHKGTSNTTSDLKLNEVRPVLSP